MYTYRTPIANPIALPIAYIGPIGILFIRYAIAAHDNGTIEQH